MTPDVSALQLLPETDRDTLAGELASTFRQAAPWPHLVIDDAVRPDVLAIVEAAELPFARAMPTQRSYRQVKSESPVPGSDEARRLLEELSGPDFITFLEKVTGIEGLQSDPSCFWGGVHASGPTAFQALHSDFARHPVSGLYHRLNVLLYLNSDWDPAFGGDLELWDRDLSRCGAKVAPAGGRMMLLETGRDMFHCVTRMPDLPPDRLRLVLTCHYYTETPSPTHGKDPMLRRPRRPGDPWWFGFASPMDAVATLRARLRHRSRSDIETGTD